MATSFNSHFPLSLIIPPHRTFASAKTSGKNVSAAGIKHNYANSNTPINRVIAESNINQLDYYFTREDGQPFNINGKINCTLEINE